MPKETITVEKSLIEDILKYSDLMAIFITDDHSVEMEEEEPDTVSKGEQAYDYLTDAIK